MSDEHDAKDAHDAQGHDDPQAADLIAWTGFAKILLTSNEFFFVD